MVDVVVGGGTNRVVDVVGGLKNVVVVAINAIVVVGLAIGVVVVVVPTVTGGRHAAAPLSLQPFTYFLRQYFQPAPSKTQSTIASSQRRRHRFTPIASASTAANRKRSKTLSRVTVAREISTA